MTDRLVKTAVIQAAPILFNREATIDKACQLIREAGRDGCQLILLPEAFVPAYPRGFSFGMVVGSRKPEGRLLWQRYWENGVDIPSAATDALGVAAKEANAVVSIGVIERDGGTLYCTQLYFDAQGHIMGKHRKLKPTGAERLIWGEGQKPPPVFETKLGKLGGLTCWENYMPQARMSLYNQGVALYLAPTADSRETWQATMRHIACEGRCFVLGCNQFVTKSMYPTDLPGYEELADQREVMCRGGSVIVSPLGEVLAGPLWDEEGMVTAVLDRNEIPRSKLDFDAVGHYARPDVFDC